MKETTLEYLPITCFICGTDHGEFKDWEGPTVCLNCGSDIFLHGRKVVAMDCGPRTVAAWLDDGQVLEYPDLKTIRSAILEEYLERQRVAAAKKATG